MDADPYIRKLHYRAHHRGTREADALVGGFFDRYHIGWTADDYRLFEKILEEQDADIIAWAFGTTEVPDAFAGRMTNDLQRLDFIALPRDMCD